MQKHKKDKKTKESNECRIISVICCVNITFMLDTNTSYVVIAKSVI